jgi:hypothetical protein
MQSDANSSPEKSLINGKIQGKNLFIKLIFKYSEIINARSLTEMKSILVRKIVTGIYQGCAIPFSHKLYASRILFRKKSLENL